MEITACPVCGSKNIGIGTLSDGIIAGLSSWNEVCRNCGYQGASLVFDSESEYNKFLEALSNQKKQTEMQIEEKNKERTEQEVNRKVSMYSEKKNYLFEIITSLAFTIVSFIVLYESHYFGIYNDIVYQKNLDNIIIYILGSFIGLFLFFFLFILLVETIYRSIGIEKK